MHESQTVQFFLDEEMKASAEAGKHPFIAKLVDVLESAGLRSVFRQNSVENRLASARFDGYALFHMDDPLHERALTIRRNLYYPFWQIERSAKRWEWRVAMAEFDPEQVPQEEAVQFYRRWRKRLFGAPDVTREGFVYVPLQGRILERRSFQTASPVDMIEAVLAHDPKRLVIAGLHPKESYSAEELGALEVLAHAHPRLSLRRGEMEDLLARCDYVVSENSSVAFAAHFFKKPSVLFAQIDFHHRALNVADIGAREAITCAPDWSVAHAAYVWWFLQHMSINASLDTAPDKIRATLRRYGWPV
ncbi:hypothetical protein [Litorivita sp. NS0012-18]|uniref:hypothetical protein n=1 Tax=Litorivita sp. NS0012-18 TaxID=3127655 RepID=UPI00310A8B7A